MTALLQRPIVGAFPVLTETAGDAVLSVREMRLDDVDLRIDYFLGADPEFLRWMGVNPALLPGRAQWRQQYAADYARPREHRRLFGLVLELDGAPVGFSNVGLLDDEASALVHFHLVDPALRGRGLGTRFLRLATRSYFAGFGFDHLYYEPNAFNTPSNRMAQAAGYRYLFTHLTTPGPIHLIDQPMTRWRIRRADLPR
jgi:RimJ/RimL family protein N-acetyltransferase